MLSECEHGHGPRLVEREVELCPLGARLAYQSSTACFWPLPADDWDDPFEATRKRIEKLKADGTLSEPPREPPSQTITGTLVDPPSFGEGQGEGALESPLLAPELPYSSASPPPHKCIAAAPPSRCSSLLQTRRRGPRSSAT